MHDEYGDFDFEDLYDPETLAALDACDRARAEPEPVPDAVVSRISRWSRTATVGAVLTGFALGLQEVLDPREQQQIVVEVDEAGRSDHLPIQLFLDPDSPSGSLCLVRRTAPPPQV